MRVIFDTHLVLWSAFAQRKLPEEARRRLAREDTIAICSVATLWETAIKTARGRPDFRVDPHILRSGLARSGWEELPIGPEHALAAAALPPIHGDPFDRVLVAQATIEGALLLTSDPVVARYPGPVRLV